MKKEWIAVIVLIAAVLFFIFKSNLMNLLSDLFKKFEGFSPTPYWDVRQYSWGYGTKVPQQFMLDGKPKPGIRISREQAMNDAMNHANASRKYLESLIKVSLTNNQWAAILSFAYNEGDFNADNLIPNINSKNWSALEKQWKLYTKVQQPDGSYKDSTDLKSRRAAEWNLFYSSLN
jgi:GH24 family phage-related lysozyme (muramidase)